MTRAEMRASLASLPSWVLAQKATANRQLITVMRQRLATGEQVARMYQAPGLAWLERQAEAAEQLLADQHAVNRCLLADQHDQRSRLSAIGGRGV
jgi:hypothetical protein